MHDGNVARPTNDFKPSLNPFTFFMGQVHTAALVRGSMCVFGSESRSEVQ